MGSATPSLPLKVSLSATWKSENVLSLKTQAEFIFYLHRFGQVTFA